MKRFSLFITGCLFLITLSYADLPTGVIVDVPTLGKPILSGRTVIGIWEEFLLRNFTANTYVCSGSYEIDLPISRTKNRNKKAVKVKRIIKPILVPAYEHGTEKGTVLFDSVRVMGNGGAHYHWNGLSCLQQN